MAQPVLIDRLRCPYPEELFAPEALLDWLEPNRRTMRGRAEEDVRAETARKIALRLEDKTLQQEIEKWLLIWAGSPTTRESGFSPAELIALQFAAAPIYGGTTEHLKEQLLRDDVMRVLREKGGFLRLLLKAMYDETREELAARGIERVTLWRGAKEKIAPTQKETFKVIALPLQPLTSFTHKLAQAVSFTPSHQGTLFSVSVPASRILATPATGFGVLQQREEIVFSLPPKVKLLDEGLVAQSNDRQQWQKIRSFEVEDWVELLEQLAEQQEEIT